MCRCAPRARSAQLDCDPRAGAGEAWDPCRELGGSNSTKDFRSPHHLRRAATTINSARILPVSGVTRTSAFGGDLERIAIVPDFDRLWHSWGLLTEYGDRT